MRLGSVAMAVLAALSGGAVSAQEETGPYRTAVSVVGGLSVGSSRSSGFGRRGGFEGRGSGSGFTVGGGLAHDFSSRLTLEATGLYLDRNAGAWSADAGLRLNLMPSGASIVPYFAVSGGAYGDRSERRVADLRDSDDRRNPTASRPGRVPGPRGRAPLARGGGADDRARPLAPGSSRRTDALMTLGGGALFSAGPHVFVRPDARAQVVFSGDTRVRGLFTLDFGYRF